MAKSSTRKKFVKKPKQTIPKEVVAATDYIKQWTRNELGKLQQNRDTSVCIPVKNGYKIGLYNLRVSSNKTCEVFDYNNESVHVFKDKVSAVLYTIYTIKKRYWIAEDILRLDQEIIKNYMDVLSMRRCLEGSRTRKDYVSVDITEARLNIAEARLAIATEKMQSIHRTAKLAKVWE